MLTVKLHKIVKNSSRLDTNVLNILAEPKERLMEILKCFLGFWSYGKPRKYTKSWF